MKNSVVACLAGGVGSLSIFIMHITVSRKHEFSSHAKIQNFDNFKNLIKVGSDSQVSTGNGTTTIKTNLDKDNAKNRLEIDDGNPRVRLLKILKEEGPQAALKMAKSYGGIDREIGIGFVLRTLITTDPDFVAGELATSGLEDAVRDQILEMLVSNWPNVDRAWEWANSALTGSQRDIAILELVGRFAKESPTKALGIINKMLPGRSRDETLGQLTSSWASIDFSAAISFAFHLEDDRDRQLALSRLAPIWVKKDLQSALAYLSNSPDDPNAEMLAHLAALESVERNPPAALNWAAALTGPAAERGGRSVVIAWTNKDPLAASRYISSLDIKLLTKFSLPLVSAWTQIAPEAAGAWVLTCSPDVQENAIVPLLHRWHELSPVDAWAWLGKMPDNQTKKVGLNILMGRDSCKNTSDLIQKYSEWYRDLTSDGILFGQSN